MLAVSRHTISLLWPPRRPGKPYPPQHYVELWHQRWLPALSGNPAPLPPREAVPNVYDLVSPPAAASYDLVSPPTAQHASYDLVSPAQEGMRLLNPGQVPAATQRRHARRPPWPEAMEALLR